MEELRIPFQGLMNIIRFNWPFYVYSILFLLLLFITSIYIPHTFRFYFLAASSIILTGILSSLLVSYYIYDYSGLYKLDWLNALHINEKEIIINIHAGFDETSCQLKNKFKNAILIVFDFYNAEKHTEHSIKRARAAYPPFENTCKINTANLPLKDNYADKIYITFSAHEIRNEDERIIFFSELCRILKPTGSIIVTEHLRDAPNFLAYNIGCFHFYSKKTWLYTFKKANLSVKQEIKITPFVSNFILNRNGTTL